jgi:hypothetical protein
MSELQKVVDEVSSHINSVTNLNSFESVRIWDEKSIEYTNILRNDIQKLESELSQLNKLYQLQSQEWNNLGFLKRIGKKDESVETKNTIDTVTRNISKLKWFIDTIEEWVDLTPDDLEECKLMIKDYKVLRKELVLEKKSSTSSLRDVREQSMNRMSQVGFINGSTGRFIRDMERMKKQTQLNKHQSLRDEIEQQILQVDKKIIWLEKIIKG